MSVYLAASSALTIVTDAMSESRTFPVNLLGTVVYRVGERLIEEVEVVVEAIESHSPVVLRTKAQLRQDERNAFEIGRDMGTAHGPALRQPIATVRSLHSV